MAETYHGKPTERIARLLERIGKTKEAADFLARCQMEQMAAEASRQ